MVCAVITYHEASFSTINMLSCEFSRTRFLLLINYLQKSPKLHTAKISTYTVQAGNNEYNYALLSY